MKKLVIYKSVGKMLVTPEDNYNSRIVNAFLITDASEFENPNDVIEYYNKYFGPTEFIVKC